MIEDYSGDLDNLRDVLVRETDQDWYIYSDNSGIYLTGVKWYRWDIDLDRISQEYDMNFSVERYGEEPGDIERIVVSPGRTRLEAATISWPT